MDTKGETTGTTEEGGRKKLFVAGVSWSTTDDGFLNFFARFGDVSEAVVMRERNGRSRGFGFVTFKDPGVAEKLQSQTLTLDGRKLDIMEAIPRQDMLASSKPLPKKLYVAGISWTTTDDGLFNFFSRYGNVVSAQIQRDRSTGRSRGFGFVTFEEAATAEKVLAEPSLSLDSRRLEIKAAVPRGLVQAYEEQQRIAASRPKKIFVAGLTEGIVEEDLKEHFGTYGRIVECYIQKDRTTGESRGFGFLSFESPDIVEKILLKPQQKIGDKCVIDIKIARPKEAPPPTRGAAVWSSFGPPIGAWGAPGWGGQSFGGPWSHGGRDALTMRPGVPSGLDRRSAPFGGTTSAPPPRGDFQAFQPQGYGYGMSAPPTQTGPSHFGETPMGVGFNQWSAPPKIDEPRAGFDTGSFRGGRGGLAPRRAFPPYGR